MADDHESQSVVKPLWAITWRSIVFIPFMLVFGMFLLGVALSLVVLPLFSAVYAYYHLWWPALGYLIEWFVVWFVWRGIRLRRFFKWPPSFL